MKVKHAFVIAVIACQMNGCGKKAHDGSEVNKFSSIDTVVCNCDSLIFPEPITIELDSNAIPEYLLNISIEKGDCRFMGVAGFGLKVPGVEDYYPKFAETNGVKIIKGTGDYIPRGTLRKFPGDADSFAYEYNLLLLEYLNTNCYKNFQ